MAANPAISIAEARFEPNSKLQVRVRAKGRINSDAGVALERSLRDLMPKYKRIVLDLSEADYIESSGLDALVRICLRAKNSECVLEIANPKPRLQDLLRTWLHSVFAGHEELLGMTPD
jgi:anti-anti-sigma factor